MNQQRFASIDESTLEDDIDEVFSLNDNSTTNNSGVGVAVTTDTIDEQEMSDV